MKVKSTPSLAHALGVWQNGQISGMQVFTATKISKWHQCQNKSVFFNIILYLNECQYKKRKVNYILDESMIMEKTSLCQLFGVQAQFAPQPLLMAREGIELKGSYDGTTRKYPWCTCKLNICHCGWGWGREGLTQIQDLLFHYIFLSESYDKIILPCHGLVNSLCYRKHAGEPLRNICLSFAINN